MVNPSLNELILIAKFKAIKACLKMKYEVLLMHQNH